MNGWYLAFSQIKRNPLRCGLTACGLIIAAAVTTAAALLMAGVSEGIATTTQRLGADVMVVPRGETVARQFNEALVAGKPAMFYLQQSTVEKVSKTPGVARTSTQVFVETLTNAKCCAGRFFIVAIDPDTDFTVKPWLQTTLPELTRENWMIVGDRILLRKGAKADFYGTSFTVAGVLEPTGTGMDWTIYISHEALRKMVAASATKAEMPLRISADEVSTILIKAEPGVDLIDLAEKIEAIAPETQAILSSTVATIARSQLSGVIGVLIAIVCGLWVMALALNGVFFSLGVRERRSQIGLLAAKGADKRFLFAMLTKESAMIAAVASLLGCVVGLLIVVSFRQLLSDVLGVIDALPSPGTTVVYIAVFTAFGVATAVLSAIAPVVAILRIEPYEAIKQGKTT